MSKLDVLNAYLVERLMVAVREILAAVGETMSEFKEESDRTRRENECLRRRLLEEGVGNGAPRSEAAHPLSHSEQGWSSGLKEELAVNEDERSDCEKQRSEQKNEELGGQPFDRTTCSKPECIRLRFHASAFGALDAMFKPQGVKQDNDNDKDSVDIMLHAVSETETDWLPPHTTPHIKDEPEAAQCTAEQPADSFQSPSPLGIITRSSNGDFKAHLQSHARKKRYRCSQCEKTFGYSGHLKEHERIHTGERPYKCTFCGKCFRLSGHLKEHVRVHTGERPFSCMHCGKSFKQSGSLNSHLRIHKGETVYRCKICGKVYGKIAQLNRHLHYHRIGKT